MANPNKAPVPTREHAMIMNGVHIWDVRIKETPYAYECQASVRVDGKTFSFSLLVPPGTWAKIESGFGRQFGDCEVRQLFEARIKQYIESGNLRDIPAEFKIDLRCLHEL